MKRINVTLDDELYEKLEARAQTNGSKSISQQIRELVDLALKIEAAAQNNEDGDGNSDQEKILSLLKNNLIWALETRLLARYIVELLPDTDKTDHLGILEKYKEKANHYVEGMLNAGVK
tara:strand:+ start:414 stop:770 length:357 start_codon:yes stop_codon:yes gene_type:complete